MKLFNVSALLFLSFIATPNVFCQKPGKDSRIKSVVVVEEKPDMLVKKQYKESETYYDTAGNIIEEISYKNGDIKTHFKYQYNTDGNKIKEEMIDQAGRTIETSEYKMENGLRVEKIVYDANKRIKSRKIYSYTTY